MKQLLILSGKGGTGKTTIASAFIKLSDARAYADCDVDAPNLHLLQNDFSGSQQTDFLGMNKAFINSNSCINCGLCQKHCNFSAIQQGEFCTVDPFSCEGCGLCVEICPEHCISMISNKAGDLELFAKDSTVFSTAQLKMGNGTSGKLVSSVKKQLFKNAQKDAPFAIIDGSPGIGCPVIASMSGVDLVLIVAEPSLSGISDMTRIIATAGKFNVSTVVCVNKCDTNTQKTIEIEQFCTKNNIPFVGKIPYDKNVVLAQNKAESIINYPSQASDNIKSIYDRTIKLLLEQ